jgi:hypothetical protein
LLRQLLTESALLACAAALCALVVVWTILRLVTVFIPFLGFVPRVSWPVTAFTFGVALSVGVLFGLAPALHATRLAVAGVLRDSSATVAAVRARLQRGLVVAQIALTQPLMVLLAAVLFVLADVQPDRRSDSSDRVIVTGDIAPALATGMTLAVGADQASDLVQRLAVRMEAIPGVQSVSIGRGGASRIGTYFVGAERPAEPRAGVRVAATPADPRHFEVMGLSLVRGRSFNDEDAASAAESPIIVGDDVARELWGDTDAVGRRLEAISDTASVRTLVVVGVVDVAGSQADASDIRVYVPADTSRPAVSLLIRTAGLAGPLIPTVRGIIDKEAPATEVALHTLAQVEALRARPFRMLANGVSAAGVMALFISAIGLYAVIAFAVGQRTREIAIRIAVGGRREQLVRRFVADGLRLCAFGLVLGLPVSLAGLQVLIVILRFPWPVPMPPIIATAILGITIVASAAVWIPARNAASVDPALTLRRE